MTEPERFLGVWSKLIRFHHACNLEPLNAWQILACSLCLSHHFLQALKFQIKQSKSAYAAFFKKIKRQPTPRLKEVACVEPEGVGQWVRSPLENKSDINFYR